MTDDLVKRLRQLGDKTGLMFVDYDTTIEAADRIEKLEAALRICKQEHGYGFPLETTRMIDAALEGSDD